MTIGRIVHLVLPADCGFRVEHDRQHGVGAHRPAIVTHIWPTEPGHDVVVNLQAFTECEDDGIPRIGPVVPNVMRFVSVVEDQVEKRPGTWHWPEREE